LPVNQTHCAAPAGKLLTERPADSGRATRYNSTRSLKFTK
jgi:hypothetical protein